VSAERAPEWEALPSKSSRSSLALAFAAPPAAGAASPAGAAAAGVPPASPPRRTIVGRASS